MGLSHRFVLLFASPQMDPERSEVLILIPRAFRPDKASGETLCLHTSVTNPFVAFHAPVENHHCEFCAGAALRINFLRLSWIILTLLNLARHLRDCETYLCTVAHDVNQFTFSSHHEAHSRPQADGAWVWRAAPRRRGVVTRATSSASW